MYVTMKNCVEHSVKWGCTPEHFVSLVHAVSLPYQLGAAHTLCTVPASGLFHNITFLAFPFLAFPCLALLLLLLLRPRFAVRAYSDSLRLELAPFGVKVMHVAPGRHGNGFERYIQITGVKRYMNKG
jgi:hypothetical protein